MTPGELVTLMNEYLSAMTDIIESHGGYVDKYIGDSIVAMFGAPADDPASRAQRAFTPRCKCREQLAELNVSSPAFAGRDGARTASGSTAARPWSAISARAAASTTP